MVDIIRQQHCLSQSTTIQPASEEVETLRSKLSASQFKYSKLMAQFTSLKQQWGSSELTNRSLQSQVTSYKESLCKQQLYYSRALEYMNQEIKLGVKSQKVWIDYLRRENLFLKTRVKAKTAGNASGKDHQLQKIDRNPINLLIWKVDELSSGVLNSDSKFKKLLVPFFSALYGSSSTDQLFEQCVKLFQNCGEYEEALNKGEKVACMVDEFQKQAQYIIGDDESFEANYL